MQLIQIGHEASLGRLLNVASAHLFRQFNLSSAWIVYYLDDNSEAGKWMFDQSIGEINEFNS